MGVAPPPLDPPQPPTSHETKSWVDDPLGSCTKEEDGKEGVGSRKKRGEEEKGGGEEEVEAAVRQEPGRHLPPPPPTDDRTQGNGKHHR
jgi:hypothetical protein